MQIVLQGTIWFDVQLLQHAVIGAHGVFRRDFIIGDEAQKRNERQLMFRVVDFAAVQRDARAVFFRVGQHFKSVVGGAGGTAENTGNQIGIVGGELLHKLGAVIHHLEKQWSPGLGDTGQIAHDVIVDKVPEFIGINGVGSVGIKHFEKITKALFLGFKAKLAEDLQNLEVAFQIIVKGDRVQTEIGAENTFVRRAFIFAALDVINRCRTKRARGKRGVTRSGGDVNVRGVVGARRRRNGAVVKQSLINGQEFIGAGGHEDNIHFGLLDDVADLLAVLGQRAVFAFNCVVLRAFPRRGNAKRHIGVFGISKHKIFARVVGVNSIYFLVQRFLHSIDLKQSGYVNDRDVFERGVIYKIKIEMKQKYPDRKISPDIFMILNRMSGLFHQHGLACCDIVIGRKADNIGAARQICSVPHAVVTAGIQDTSVQFIHLAAAHVIDRQIDI